MNRITGTTLLFAVCVLAVAGCRNRRDTPREPTKNRLEADMFYQRKEQETSLHARPKERRTLVYGAGNWRAAEQQAKAVGDVKTFWKNLYANQKKWEEDKDSQEMVSKRKAEAEKADSEDEFFNFGVNALAYLTEFKNQPKEYSEENGLKWLRRKNKHYVRKWLDGNEGQLVEERLWYADMIGTKKYSLVPFVDLREQNFEYIVAVSSGGGGGGGGMMGMPGGGGGGGESPNVFLSSGKTGSEKAVPGRINAQELRVLYWCFNDYRATIPPKSRDPYIPGDPLYSDFMKHLKAKAPVALMDDIEYNIVYIHKPADDILRGNLACRTERLTNGGYLTVTINSPDARADGNPFGVQLPQPKKKDEPGGGMPGMPGMPGMAPPGR